MPSMLQKKCPFCGEEIHAEAVKCRFCKEFLEDAEGLPVSYYDRRTRRGGPSGGPERLKRRSVAGSQADVALFSTTPSLWGLLGFYVTCVLLAGLAFFLWRFPIGNAAVKLVPSVSNEMAVQITRYCRYTGIALLLITIGNGIIRTVQLKSMHYEVSIDRIEFARGIFSRRIDNLDMFRVVDIKLHRSLLDCLVRVGTVTLMTKDETDPVFEFEKVSRPKELYDIIKRAALEADRKQGVIHVD